MRLCIYEPSWKITRILSAGVDDHAFRRGLATSGVLLYPWCLLNPELLWSTSAKLTKREEEIGTRQREMERANVDSKSCNEDPSILPRWQMEVAQSITKGKASESSLVHGQIKFFKQRRLGARNPRSLEVAECLVCRDPKAERVGSQTRLHLPSTLGMSGPRSKIPADNP